MGERERKKKKQEWIKCGKWKQQKNRYHNLISTNPSTCPIFRLFFYLQRDWIVFRKMTFRPWNSSGNYKNLCHFTTIEIKNDILQFTLSSIQHFGEHVSCITLCWFKTFHSITMPFITLPLYIITILFIYMVAQRKTGTFSFWAAILRPVETYISGNYIFSIIVNKCDFRTRLYNIVWTIQPIDCFLWLTYTRKGIMRHIYFAESTNSFESRICFW